MSERFPYKRFTKEEKVTFLAALDDEKVQGNLTIASLRTGIPYGTAYRHYMTDKSFKKKVDKIKRKWDAVIIDIAENKLFGHIANGNLTAIKFTLPRLDKERWSEKIQVSKDPNDKPEEVEHKHSVSPELADILRKINGQTK